MNRLQSELRRLYFLPASASGAGPHEELLATPAGDTRTLVMELAGPADWDALSRVWRGVQAELQLPAPAIAVSGTDGLQLWFSLQAPIGARRAEEFLTQLRRRYLADIAPARVRLMPSAAAPALHAAPVPAQQAATENWSAFVAPDLAPVFADTPWLDIQPGVEGQADLLAKLESIKPAALDAAMQRLSAAAAPVTAPPSPSAEQDRPPPRAAGDAPAVDPRAFLNRVMNDETVDLALRVEAAKALLQY